VFIETIFLKLLDSTNSTFQLKNQILGVFDRISKQTTMLLEIFVNYDCDMQQKDLTGRMIESLCKIANFKQKVNDAVSADAVHLRNYATKILVQILRSFNGTIDAKIAESKIMSRLSQANQTLTSTDDQTEGTESHVSLPGRSSLGDDIQNKRNQKQILAQAAKKFNFKPKAGIAFLV
jgi:Sec7-like guanine-nucleotide exchange factor